MRQIFSGELNTNLSLEKRQVTSFCKRDRVSPQKETEREKKAEICDDIKTIDNFLVQTSHRLEGASGSGDKNAD